MPKKTHVPMKRRPRVFLADDHTMLLDAFRRLLEPRCEIVGTACDGRALVDLAASTQPDVIVLDISMPLLNGMDACAQLRLSFGHGVPAKHTVYGPFRSSSGPARYVIVESLCPCVHR